MSPTTIKNGHVGIVPERATENKEQARNQVKDYPHKPKEVTKEI